MGIWAIIKVGLVALGLVLIPWFFYANQDTQKLRCVGYELSSTPRPFVWTVTCALNGHE